MKIFAVLSLFIFINFVTPRKIQAAKKFVPKKTSTNTASKTNYSSIPTTAKYRPDKLGLIFYFRNFSNIDSANYSFTYTSNGIPQGIGGIIREDNNPQAERELLFGTCSGGVCTYHSNIQDAKLIVLINYKNGTQASKLYRIKTYR